MLCKYPSNSTPFRSRASLFQLTGPFETSAQNDPQIFAQRPDVFELQTILRQVHQITHHFRSTASHFRVTGHMVTCTE